PGIEAGARDAIDFGRLAKDQREREAEDHGRAGKIPEDDLGLAPARPGQQHPENPGRRGHQRDPLPVQFRHGRYLGAPAASKNFNAIMPCVAAPPARSAAAMRDASTISSRVAPAAFAPFACASRQYGHCVVQATAIASSSRYLRGIAPSRPTILSRPTHASKSAGASFFISFRSPKSAASW